ncbi:hypothetical protein LQF12_07040 [Ruania suaedae]|uniref:hypothetical protein n=1 Tax=Ruania suaedae TaxID=2897774 RepID=UPI001E51B9A9|nr:hypothetical protein [Ruania suaedae]UFU04327.1 hypothetical protein LQF12_07040 [Ruania suaedae]
MPITLPRSVLATLWVDEMRTIPPADRAPTLTTAVRAIQGEDEPHIVLEHGNGVETSSAETSGAGHDLARLLAELAATRALVHAALPVPGEIGVPAALSHEASEVGEAILAVGGPGEATVAALPHVVEFGSAWEPGAMVTWHVRRDSGTVPVPDSPSDARRRLTEALELAIDALTRMDVARWRPEAAEQIADLASGTVPEELAQRLPGRVERRRLDLLVRAARLDAIVQLAAEDDGAAVNVWQVDQRGAAMRHVAAAARRAMVSATLSVPEQR